MKAYYDTLIEAISNLNDEGYTEDFELQEKTVLALYSKKSYLPKELTIVKSYRFFGNSDVGDESELFVIEAPDKSKGTLVISYGAEQSQNTALLKDIPTS